MLFVNGLRSLHSRSYSYKCTTVTGTAWTTLFFVRLLVLTILLTQCTSWAGHELQSARLFLRSWLLLLRLTTKIFLYRINLSQPHTSRITKMPTRKYYVFAYLFLFLSEISIYSLWAFHKRFSFKSEWGLLF